MRLRASVLAVGLAAVSLVFLVLRLLAASRVGFGDSEALYAAYALHPAPAYLDHPGLVGLFARALGAGATPSPVLAHRVTAVLATLAPWATVLAARGVGAGLPRALAAGLVTAVVPEIAVGLFAMTPDLPLFFAWTAALGLAGAGLRAPASTLRASSFLVLAGLAGGVGLAAKASGAGLALALILTYASKPARAHATTPWPWAGLLLGAIVVSPVVAYEARDGYPMIHHRLVATQADAGLSLRNLGALLGGQLVYVSPILAVLGALAGYELWRARREGVVSTLLACAVVAPLALLVPLCLWSKVAEPHWIAPAWVALPLAWAARDAPFGPRRVSRTLVRAGVALAAVMSLAVHAWVLLPGLVAWVPEKAYSARVDISNELFGWPEAAALVRDLAGAHRAGSPAREDIVLAGPHWVVCAQLDAALGAWFPVGCTGEEPADYAAWNPMERWEGADLVIFVTDERFPTDVRALFPRRTRIDGRTLEVYRGGRRARRLTIEVLALREIG